MADAVQRGKDPESLHTAQRLAAAEEECLGVDAATLAIMEDKLPISEKMKKKRRLTTMGCPSYAEEEDTLPEEDGESVGNKESRSSGAASGGPPP